LGTIRLCLLIAAHAQYGSSSNAQARHGQYVYLLPRTHERLVRTMRWLTWEGSRPPSVARRLDGICAQGAAMVVLQSA